jgi:hypothetical protein
MTGDSATAPSTTNPAAKGAEAAPAPAQGVAQGKRGAPWRGRRKVADPKSKIVPIRFSAEQYERLEEKASRAGLSIGTWARTILLGSPGPRAVKRPPIEKAELARLLGAIGKLGGNVNQIAKALNEGRDAPSLAELAEMRADITAMRAEIMVALGRRSEP